ncbi:MAG: Sec-independent protein translocase protein TatB [Gammaproteobacteria bacterium]|nr:Sec-independent protein translocase protein TatB [Gammaproteobacteria bacterium]
MFDMGFTELVLIGIVGLVVIGPERLPAVARTAGKYFGRLRRFMSSVKSDVESELRADELRDILNKQNDELQSLKKVVDDVGRDVSSSVNEVEESVADITEGEIGQSWTDSLSTPESEDISAPELEKPPAKAAKKKAAKKKAVKKKAVKPKAGKVSSNE